MRVWDVSPGYLSRQSLLGEHRELHGLHSILLENKKGYSRHPETLRWVGCLSGLTRRHSSLVAEMSLRGYTDRSPISDGAEQIHWPETFVTPPAMQYDLLAAKYAGRDQGRIPLPSSAQELWAHHKYSVMARDPAAYRRLGPRIARMRRGADMTALAEELVHFLRRDPPAKHLLNALEHIWGHVSKMANAAEKRAARVSPGDLFFTTRALATQMNEPYLMASTALSDFALYVGAVQDASTDAGCGTAHRSVQEPA